MTFLQALYGSQYQEITQRGGDGQKGRINGNLLLTAIVFMLMLLFFMILLRLAPSVNQVLGNWLGADEAPFSARIQGKLMALPVMGLIYFIISKTTGNKLQYETYVAAFMQYPDDIKSEANKKILIPFLLLLVALSITAIS